MARKRGMGRGESSEAMFESEAHAPMSGSGKMHNLEYKIEYFPDNDMHDDVHERMYGYRDGSHMKAGRGEYVGGHPLKTGGASMMEIEAELKTHSGGRMARRDRQYKAAGKSMGNDVDDTVYGRLPPVPGRIDS